MESRTPTVFGLKSIFRKVKGVKPYRGKPRNNGVQTLPNNYHDAQRILKKREKHARRRNKLT